MSKVMIAAAQAFGDRHELEIRRLPDRRDDPTCTPVVKKAGQGYVDTGEGHIARNETGQPAADMTVIIASVGGAFRGELDAPAPNCGF